MKYPLGSSSNTSILRKAVLFLVAVVIILILGWMFISKTKYKQPFFSGSTIVDDSKFEKESEGKGTAITNTVSSTTPTPQQSTTPPTPQQSTTPPTVSTDNQPTIFIITPTYTRVLQKVELTRQCQTFTLVNDIHWIVIEDSDTKTELVDKLLNHCSVDSTLLNHETSAQLKKPKAGQRQNRGAIQRNIGLEWLREHYKPGDIQGVVYFADDDNTYDARLFEEMRSTQKVSVWPVGFAGGLRAEGPICKDGHVTGFHASWAPKRTFPLDMAAFAVNLDVLLRNPKIIFDPNGVGGHLETIFLEKIVTKQELEPKADNCTEILVWHTQTKTPVLAYETKNPTSLQV